MSIDANSTIEQNLQQLVLFCSEVLERLRNDCQPEHVSSHSRIFDYDLYFGQVTILMRHFDEAITKFSSHFKDPSKLQECADCSNQLLDVVARLFDCIDSVHPNLAGNYFCLEVKRGAKGFFELFKGFLTSLSNQGALQRRTRNALVKQVCESGWSLPCASRTNAAAASKVLRNSLRLVEDVISELKDEQSLQIHDHFTSDEEPEIAGSDGGILTVNQVGGLSTDDGSDSGELAIVRYAEDLLDCCLKILKKSIEINLEDEKCCTLESIRWVDMFCNEALTLNQLIDSFGTALFPPINGPAAVSSATEIVKVMENLINLLRQQYDDAQTAWLNGFPALLSRNLSSITDRFPER